MSNSNSDAYSARTTYFGHMDMIPWNQHHILHISHHSSVWYPVIQYNSSHITMLLVSVPLIPFLNCLIDLDWQGQYLISGELSADVASKPRSRSFYVYSLNFVQQHQMTPDPFFRCETSRFFVSQTLPWHSHRSSHGTKEGMFGGPGCGVWTGTETTWEDRMRERKRKSESVFERRISASLI